MLELTILFIVSENLGSVDRVELINTCKERTECDPLTISDQIDLLISKHHLKETSKISRPQISFGETGRVYLHQLLNDAEKLKQSTKKETKQKRKDKLFELLLCLLSAIAGALLSHLL